MTSVTITEIEQLFGNSFWNQSGTIIGAIPSSVSEQSYFWNKLRDRDLVNNLWVFYCFILSDVTSSSVKLALDNRQATRWREEFPHTRQCYYSEPRSLCKIPLQWTFAIAYYLCTTLTDWFVCSGFDVASVRSLTRNGEKRVENIFLKLFCRHHSTLFAWHPQSQLTIVSIP